MEEGRRLPGGGSGSTKLRAPAPKTEPVAEAPQAREGERGAVPVRVKREDISEVPLKVPRFQYVDFPSLHQCIQQLTVPPLDSWLTACRLGRPPSRAPATPKERPPKFKYVDFPSLHRCIKQLSVPPIESWSSGLARPERGDGEGDGRGSGLARPERGDGEGDRRGSGSQSSSGKGSRPGQDSVATPTRNQEKYTAFQFPGFNPCPVQCVSTSDQASHRPRLPGQPSGPPRASYAEEAQEKMIRSSDGWPKQPPDQTPCFPKTKRDRGTESLAKSHKMPAADEGGVAEVHQEKKSLQTRPRQTPSEHADSGPGDEFWRAVPESVCPFCQKMFSDSEQLRIHQRSHLEKRPH